MFVGRIQAFLNFEQWDLTVDKETTALPHEQVNKIATASELTVNQLCSNETLHNTDTNSHTPVSSAEQDC